ncbi:hypothetical protein [Pseudomonas aeruginosa]|uniref:hypothetical protein n=1 Tax=Pseudomonas aeruginosa TaxID=287 RepID=UPI000F61714B|nr:hypothetical protein [Pseudomonas aeruginosa]RRH85411.1 hypothetical protein EIM22_03670 [Pseudomonas aeruginosa]HCW1033978.1 hypothetical protein [Pseudomonas aeruginosa]HCW1045671.1 hypothetical protein [Pseudomonas aeruginosa]HDY5503645.1 hypothetical protein [Pseudomonas aeruginosa]
MSLRKIILVPFLSLALAGCNDAIDTVKNGRMKINDQYTVDQAFSNRSICDSVDWDVITDDRNRELVQYKCHITGIESYYEQEKQRTRENVLSGFDMERRAAQVHLEPARMEVEAAENALSKPRPTSNISLDSDRLNELLAQETLLTDNPPSRSLQNYSNSPEVAEAAQRYFLGYVRDPASPQFAAHKQNEQELLQAIEAARAKVQVDIDEERARLSEVQNAREQESVAYAQQRLSRAKELYGNLQNAVAAKLEGLDAQHAAKLKQFDDAATIESVAEVFQWVVKGEEIELVWSGLEGTYSDGQVKTFGHINRLGSLQDVYRNSAEAYSDLRQKAPLM